MHPSLPHATAQVLVTSRELPWQPHLRKLGQVGGVGMSWLGDGHGHVAGTAHVYLKAADLTAGRVPPALAAMFTACLHGPDSFRSRSSSGGGRLCDGLRTEQRRGAGSGTVEHNLPGADSDGSSGTEGVGGVCCLPAGAFGARRHCPHFALLPLAAQEPVEGYRVTWFRS
jgi:hypothetical protein